MGEGGRVFVLLVQSISHSVVGEVGLMLRQSEKRLTKDLRRLRMVSAFSSSWLRLGCGTGVSGMLKVLVRDWDLL